MLPFWTEMGLARIEAAGLWLNPRCVNTDENLTVPITSKSGYKQKSWCGINKTRSWSPRHRRAGTRGQLASHGATTQQTCPGIHSTSAPPATPTGRNKCHFGSKALIKHKRQNTHFRINPLLVFFFPFRKQV